MDGFKTLLYILLLLLLRLPVIGQFQYNGAAYNLGNECFAFQANGGFKAGTVWNTNAFDLDDSLDITLEFYLGCPEDEINKGFVFVFQTQGISTGNYIGETGYEDIAPSLAIEVDIRQDSEQSDPDYNHMAMFTNGVLDHTAAENIAGPVPVLEDLTTVQDCQAHDLRVIWFPQASRLDVYIDCQIRLTQVIDVQALFGDYENMYWGFTSGNFIVTNTVEFCPQEAQGIDELEDISICVGENVQLNAPLNNVSYLWEPSLGLSDPTIANPIATPEETTTYSLLMIDDCGESYEEEITITVVHTTTNFDLGPADTLICSEEPLLLDATLDNATYRWENGSTDPIRFVETSGEYAVTVTIPECEISDRVEVTFSNLPELNWPTDTVSCVQEPFFLSAESPGATYNWQDGSNGSDFEVKTSGSYQVTVTNTCGSISRNIQVELLDCLEFYLPNAFSPNDDGINDIFFVQGGGSSASIESFRIFDRWGALVFEAENIQANDPSKGWNGKFQSKVMVPGVYIYVLEASLINGKSTMQSGEIVLVR